MHPSNNPLLPTAPPTLLLATVILPLSVAANYTYYVPTALQAMVREGMRVEVQFGEKRMYAGVIQHLYEAAAPPNIKLKPIGTLLDEQAIVPPTQLRLWQWIADYYMCTTGEVMQAALPSAFKLSSQTKLLLNPDFAQDFSILNDREYLVAEALSIHPQLTIDEVQAIVATKNVVHLIKSLLEKKVILLQETLVERYKPQTIACLALSPIYQQADQLDDLLLQLGKSKQTEKQLSVLMAFLHLSHQLHTDYVYKKDLLEKAAASESALNGLVKKGVLHSFKKSVSRLEQPASTEPSLSYQLSPAQATALSEIKQQFEQKAVVLLHGATSSGKTQIYISLIQAALEQQQQVLYLLPEIALTAQMIARLRKVFGSQIGVYHSKFNDQERVEIWHKTLNNEYKIIVGARSAVFLPLTRLGLVIIDEEHDPSFKQYEPAPYYHARNTAIYLASLCGARTLLGSATPAVETYYNATQAAKYGLVKLSERYGQVQPPTIAVVNLYQAAQAGQLRSHFTQQLIDEILQTLEAKEQAIVFQNRRGYSPYLQCADCGWIPQCIQCDVRLTYHKYSNDLKCHYCDHKRPPVAHCMECGSTNVQIQGFGTEKVEEELQRFLPNAHIARLDLDAARTKHGFEQIINDFEAQKTNVLVGTQMITKGLDFDNVSLVGILSADQLLSFPDFRATERGFQLMMQVAGRAGRRSQQGKVLIQTRNTSYKTLDHVLKHDYWAFYTNEIADRQRHQYPPFVRLIIVTLKHKEINVINAASAQATRMLKTQTHVGVLGPAVPMISRIRNHYLRQIMLKINVATTQQLQQYKLFLGQTLRELQQQPAYKSLIVQIDVDPV